MGSRNRFGRKKKEEGSFDKWYRKRGEAKNRNQLSRYTARSEELSKIKNPNDWQKNQIAHAKSKVEEYSKPIKKQLAYSKEEKESIKKRQNVRKNPVSDETLAEVRKQVAKDKAKEKPSKPSTKAVWNSEKFKWEVPANVEANKNKGKQKPFTNRVSGNGGSKTTSSNNNSKTKQPKPDSKKSKTPKEPKHWIRTPLEHELGTEYKDSEAFKRDKRRKERLKIGGGTK